MEVKYTNEFKNWLDKLKNLQAKVAISRRLERISKNGALGDFKNIDLDLYELRFFVSPGIRIYFTFENDVLIILLCGGDKSSQSRDILRAKEILRELKNG